MLHPVGGLPREGGFYTGPARKDEGVKRRAHKPMVPTADVGLRAARHGISVVDGNVGRDLWSRQSEVREVTVNLCPFVWDQNSDLSRCWSGASEIQWSDDLGDLLELVCQWLVLAIPGSHAPAGFLRCAQIWNLVELLRRGVGVTPEIDADAACADPGIDLGPVVSGHS